MDNEKNLGILAYITFVGTILAFFMNDEKKSEYVYFHIRQMLGLFILFIICNVIAELYIIMSLGFWVVSFICWLLGLISAIQYKQEPIPIIGKYFQKWFHAVK
ncbi:membrane protein [Neptunitalea chrysea]|uniref:Membrane protein n=1 Tax=Neptunitalea chrysea TaxID=1647581 RepID=A0A9W6ETY8_9FLAO|nr:hypothetical protein [Neptunitalea chrysea]GLB51889.1 membrane protein [Neptunitalea chrysea]